MIFSKAALSSILTTLQFANARGKALASNQKSTAAFREGTECLPKRKKWRRRLLSSKLLGGATNDGPDVGILARCPPKQVCEDDVTSSIGGRCVAAASPSTRRMEGELSISTPAPPTHVPPTHALPTASPPTRRMEEQLCYFTCPDPKMCECAYQEVSQVGVRTRECIAAFASSCRNGDYEKCVPKYGMMRWKGYYCPYYECIDDIDDGRDDGTCKIDAHVEYYEFCKYFFLDKKDLVIESNSSYCEEVIDMFETIGPGYFQLIAEPNNFAKQSQLINQRFYECASNQLNQSVDYVEDIGAEQYTQSYEQYVQSYKPFPDECRCQQYHDYCELLQNFSIENMIPSLCKVSNCCNISIPDGNVTACFDLLYDGLYAPNEVNTPAPKVMPSSSPSMEPSTMKEIEEDNSLPDQSRHGQSSSASTHSVESNLGSPVWTYLFAITMGFFIIEHL